MFLRTHKSRDSHYCSLSAESKTEDLWRKETIWGRVYWGEDARGKPESIQSWLEQKAWRLRRDERQKGKEGDAGKKGRYETVLIPTKSKNNIKRNHSSVNGSIASKKYSQNMLIGTSLVVWWLRLHLLMQEAQVQPLVGELRSHVLCGQKIKTWNRSNIVTYIINTFKMVHIQKKKNV